MVVEGEGARARQDQDKGAALRDGAAVDIVRLFDNVIARMF
jgi:hypothetical protein